MSYDFKIVFDKLKESVENDSLKGEARIEELDEIDELRKIVIEVTEPENNLYTTT